MRHSRNWLLLIGSTDSPMRRTTGTAIACSVLLFVGLWAASSAQGFIYWANTGNTIGRAKPNGSGVDQDFLRSGQACGIAVSKSHIYWTGHANGVAGDGTIGRARLDGSHRQTKLITGANNPCGLAIDRRHIYWSNTDPAGGIGRAKLNGSRVKRKFVPTDGYACGVAVNRSHLFWGNRDVGTIGRANLSGKRSSVRQGFIGAGSNVCGVALNRAHIYWADMDSDSIGRANLNGKAASVDPAFITGASNPCGLAVDKTRIYWANSFSSMIGSANLNGTGVNQGLITANIPCWIATSKKGRKR